MVLGDPFVWPLIERLREFAATNPKAESSLERERNARWAALGVAHATCVTTANVLTLLLPTAFLRATSSILIYKVRGAKRWSNGKRVPIILIAKDPHFPRRRRLIISIRRRAESTTIWLGAFRSVSKSGKARSIWGASVLASSR